MTQAEFDAVVGRRLDLIRQTLVNKGREYVRGDDRLHNFRNAAGIERTTLERSLLGKWGKHLASVIDFVHDLDRGVTHTESEWDEKLGDVINYGVLLEAVVVERRNRTGVIDDPDGPGKGATGPVQERTPEG